MILRETIRQIANLYKGCIKTLTNLDLSVNLLNNSKEICYSGAERVKALPTHKGIYKLLLYKWFLFLFYHRS